MQVWCKRGGALYCHGVWSEDTTTCCYGHTYALAFQPLHTHTHTDTHTHTHTHTYICILHPMTVSGAHTYPTLYWGKGWCELSHHMWAAFPTVRRCLTPPPPEGKSPSQTPLIASPINPPPSPQSPLPSSGASGQQLVGGSWCLNPRIWPPYGDLLRR